MKFGSAIVLTLFLWGRLAFSQDTLKVGDIAPDFSLPYATKDSVAQDSLTLTHLVGTRYIILAFYPADWSGGCTKEMCMMRDNFSEISTLDAELLPISGDYKFAHHEWAKSQNFPFKLVSDHLHLVARKYSSFSEGMGYNKRTVFVVDKQGKIAYVDLHYSLLDAGSFEKLKDALRSLHH
jgi:glutaredoxin-dependent peroxiredoxin